VPGQANIYQPQSQPNIDYSLGNLIQGQPYSLLGQYQSGNTPAQQLYWQQAQPQSQAAFNLVNGPMSSAGQIPGNIFNNPYYDQAQTGANVYAGLVGGQYGGGQGEIANFLNQGLDLSQTGQLGVASQLQQIAQMLQQSGAGIQGYAPFSANLANQTAGLGAGVAGYAGQAGAGIGPTQAFGANALTDLPLINALGGQIAQTLPQYQAGATQIAGLAPGLGQPISALNQASNQLLQTGQDPQSALYNRTAQQVLDQQRAISAMSGVGTSPYGAGVTGQTMANFNIDWQNAQLARQAQALQGAGAGFGQAGALTSEQAALQGQALAALTGMGGQAGAAGGLYGLGQNVLGQGANAYSQAAQQAAAAGGLLGGIGGINQQAAAQQALSAGLYGQGAQLAAGAQSPLAAASNIYGGLPGLAQAYTGAYGNLGQQIAQSAAAPGQTYLGQQGQQQLALQNYLQQLGQSQGLTTGAANIGAQQYGLPLSLLQAMQNYLNTGQSAAQIGGQLGQIGTQQSTQGLAGLLGAGQLGSNLLTGQNLFGGSNSLLGGSGGLIGAASNLFGGGATPAEAFLSSGATSGGAADAFLTSGAGTAAGGGGLLDTLLKAGAA
jgi:hypothetical protein